MPERRFAHPPTVDGVCAECGGRVAIFELKPGDGLPSKRRCARCRQAGGRTRREHALALRVERALGARP